MSLEIRFFGTVDEVLADMAAYKGRAPNIAPPPQTVGVVTTEPTPLEAHLETLAPKQEAIPPEKPKRGAKAKPEPETIDAKANDVPMLTIEDARERMRQFCKDGHSEAVYGALAEFKADKLSAIDPDAGGKPSAKFAEYVAAIERIIAETPKAVA